jgi:iron-sulfur cluster assembly protein
MALDEPKTNDVAFIDQGITFTIERALFEEAKPIRLDFVESPGKSGFQLASSLPAGSGCC